MSAVVIGLEDLAEVGDDEVGVARGEGSGVVVASDCYHGANASFGGSPDAAPNGVVIYLSLTSWDVGVAESDGPPLAGTNADQPAPRREPHRHSRLRHFAD